MFSSLPVRRDIPRSLYRDSVIWIQVSFGAIFFSLSNMWITVVPRHVKLNLHYSEVIVGLVSLFFSFAAVVSRPFINRYGARQNRHHLLGIALIMMVVGGVLAVISQSLIVVFLSRFFTGVSDGVFYVALSTMIVANAQEHTKGRAINIYTVALYMGLCIGPATAELLYHFFAHAIFRVTGLVVILTCMTLAGLLRFVPSRYSEHEDSAKQSASFCPPVLFPGIVFLFGIVTWSGFESFSPLFGKTLDVDNMSPYFIVIGICVIAVRLISSSFIDRMNVHITLGLALVSAVIGGTTFATVHHQSALYIGCFFLAVSMGFFFPGFALASMRRGQQYDTGTVLGTLSMFFDLSFGITPPLLGVLITHQGFSTMFGVTSFLTAGSLLLSLFMKIPRGFDTEEALADPPMA